MAGGRSHLGQSLSQSVNAYQWLCMARQFDLIHFLSGTGTETSTKANVSHRVNVFIEEI